MNTIKTFPAININLINKSVDKFDATFTVLDETGNPYDFFSGYTLSYLNVYAESDNSTVFLFSSTGSTNQIDMSNAALGTFRVFCNTLAIQSGEYLYNFFVKNSTEIESIIYGSFTVI